MKSHLCVVVVAGGGPMLNLLQSRRTTVKVAAVPEEAPRLSLVDSVSSPTAATTISKAQGGSTSLVVDGQPVDGNVIPLPDHAGGVVEVTAVVS